MEDLFVFTARDLAPPGDAVRTAAMQIDGVQVKIDVPPSDLTWEPVPTREFVASVIGESRLDVFTYRGGSVDGVADLLERFYRDAPALVDPDSDGVFPVPEAITLIRATQGTWHPWADPMKR